MYIRRTGWRHNPGAVPDSHLMQLPNHINEEEEGYCVRWRMIVIVRKVTMMIIIVVNWFGEDKAHTLGEA